MMKYFALAILLTSLILGGCDAVEEKAQIKPTPPPPIVEEKTPAVEPQRDFLVEMFLTEPQGDWPEAAPVLTWLDSLEEGWNEVKNEGRPLLVLVHCPGSSRSGQFANDLLNPTPEMAVLLRQFITVHITDGQEIDLNRMPFRRYQDPDQTWWCWILSPQGQVYSVLGRISPESPEVTWSDAVQWMSAVLDHHWDPRREDWNADGEVVPISTPMRSIADNPEFQKWKSSVNYLGDLKNDGQCICCHQMQDVLWTEKKQAKKFRMKNDYWIWPPAEKVGVSVVDEITPELTDIASDSIFADELQVADRFGILKGKRIFSSTEFRALLNAYQDREFLAIDHELHRPSYVVRGDHVEKLEFKTYLHQVFNYDLTWRQSINQSVLASHPGYLVEPLDDATRRKLNLVGKMAFRPLVGPQSPAWAGGIRPDRIIIKFGDLSEDFTPEEFYFLYRIKVVVGGKFELTVLDGPKTRIIHPHSISVLDLPPEAIQMMKDAR